MDQKILVIIGGRGIGDLIYSKGYQIKTIQEITDFYFCPTVIISE